MDFIEPRVNGTKIVLGPARLCYVHLFHKYASDGAADDAGRYCVTILIPKTETATVSAIRKSIDAATKDAVPTKWKGRKPLVIDSPLKDGDSKDDEAFHGCYYINAKCKTRPGVIGPDRNPVTNEEEIYSGIYAMVSISFYGYNVSGNSGIAAGLNNVMKVDDGERLGGRVSPQADFKDVDFSQIDRELNGDFDEYL